MANTPRTKFLDTRVIKAVTPLALALLLLVAISGVFIYPFLFSAAGLGSTELSEMASDLLITALVALGGALVPAVVFSFDKEKFSILLALVVCLTAAVVCSWIAMLAQQVIIGDIGGLSGAVLNLTISALVGSVLSIMPALLATFICIVIRIVRSLIAQRKAPTTHNTAGGTPNA